MAAEKDNFDIPMIATVGIVSTVLTAACVIGVQALYYSYELRETDRKVTTLPTADANSKLAEQDAKLAKYGWANREQGKVVIPIERAMDLVVDEYARSDTRSQSGQFAEASSREAHDVTN